MSEIRNFVLDTESAGLDASKYGLVEIAWIEVDTALQEIDRRQSLIDPETEITASASGVHGLTAQDVSESPTLDEFFSLKEGDCYGEDLHSAVVVLIGHNIKFDYRFIHKHVSGVVQFFDTLRWARRVWPGRDDYKLQTLKYALGLPRSSGKAHRAMADVEDTLELARLILKTSGKDLSAVIQSVEDSRLLEVVPFGKFRGATWDKVDKGYMQWLKGNATNADPDLLYTLNHWLNKPAAVAA